MKKILVPTDFSPNALLALEYAALLAQKTKATIELMHGCNLYGEEFTKYKALVREHNHSVVKEDFQRLDKLKDSVNARHDVDIRTILYECGGDVTAGILQAAQDHKANLIVMGTYGETGLRRKVFGSKTADVINWSTIPVLAVPPSFVITEPKNMLLALEDATESEEQLKPFFDLAALFGAKVTVVVFTEEEAKAFELLTHTKSVQFIGQKLKRLFKNINFTVSHVVGTDFYSDLQQFVSSNQINLLSMITHKRIGVNRFGEKSLTQKLSYHLSVPLLALHKAEEDNA